MGAVTRRGRRGRVAKGSLSPLFTWRTAIARSNLPGPVKGVAYTLSLHMTELGESCWPGIPRLAAESGFSERTVQSALRTLADQGWLRVQLRAGPRKTNRYSCLVPEGAPLAPFFADGAAPAPSRCTSCTTDGAAPADESDSKGDIKKYISADAERAAVENVYGFWKAISGHRLARLTKGRRVKIQARLKTFSIEELKQAVRGACGDAFYRGENDRRTRYDWLETILKSDEAVERHIERSTQIQSQAVREAHELDKRCRPPPAWRDS